MVEPRPLLTHELASITLKIGADTQNVSEPHVSDALTHTF